MRLEVEKLPPVFSLARTFTPEELNWDDAEIALAAPLEVAGTIKRQGTSLHLAGNLHTSLKVACDRCLQLAQVAVKTKFEETLRPLDASGQHATNQAEELRAEDLQTDFYDGLTLDLGEFLRAEVLLNVPVQVLCRTNCAGLCPHCGANRNTTACACTGKTTDPRWDALKKLRS